MGGMEVQLRAILISAALWFASCRSFPHCRGQSPLGRRLAGPRDRTGQDWTGPGPLPEVGPQLFGFSD
jgi:hypothetical protein